MRPFAGVYASNGVATLALGCPKLRAGVDFFRLEMWGMRSTGYRWGTVLLAAALLASSAMAQDKDSFTPMPMDKGFGPIDLTPPSTPPEEIIKKFAAKESEFQDALNHYFSWRRGERRERQITPRSLRLCVKIYANTALRMAINFTSSSSNNSSRNILAPSLFATEGLGWVSIKSPSAPAAIAALAIVPII